MSALDWDYTTETNASFTQARLYVQIETESERLLRLSNRCADTAGALMQTGCWDELAALLEAADVLAEQSRMRALLDRALRINGTEATMTTGTT